MNKIFDVAFISDIHIDFYIDPKFSGPKLVKKMEEFIDNELWLKNADILIFAGDNSHYPQQNKLLLEMIAAKKIYKKIFVTFGNHDMYLVSNSMRKNFTTSWEKIEYFKQICEDIDTVEFLDGNIVEVDGIKIGGAGMWYDFTYGINECGVSEDKMMDLWRDKMNDAINIRGDDHEMGIKDFVNSMYDYGYGRKTKRCTFNPLKFFNSEKEKLKNIVDECDIFVSHIGPAVPPNLDVKYMDPLTGCYYFDGSEFLIKDKAPKLWFFGHTHNRYDFKVNNTWLMCNPLGYKGEQNNNEVEVVNLFNLDR